ncbi:MAG: DUF3854 domain-containing protein [Pseudobdellovibrionaceae bacterium]
MANTSWIEVTRKNPCARCLSGNWCSRSSDGNFEICRRNNDGTANTRLDKNGSEYHLYFNGIKMNSGKIGTRVYKKVPKVEDTTSIDTEELHKVYSAVIEEFELSESHREDLRKRGLLDEDIEKNRYKSLLPDKKAELLKSLHKKFDKNQLIKVPGFYLNKRGYLQLAGPQGLLVPITNQIGQIIALKVRRDLKKETADGFPKYFYISSTKRGGIGPGAPIHVPTSANKGGVKIRVTEGELKADVATALSNLPTLSIPGATIWKPLLPVLKKMRVRTVVIAIDADAATNRNVASALEKMALALKDNGYEVEIETWDGNKAKGIDDALVDKIEIQTHRGVETFKVIKEIINSAVVHDPNTEEAKLGIARKLISETLQQIKLNPSLAFQKDVLRGLLIIKKEDLGLWTTFKNKATRAGVSARKLDEAMDAEEINQRNELMPSSNSAISPFEYNTSYYHSKDELNAGSRVFEKKYEIKNGCINWNKRNSETAIPIPFPLCNFSATIEAEETIDDGIEEKKVFLISGILSSGRLLPKVRIPADQFGSMSWILSNWGASAIPVAGMGTKDHLRAAIQDLSGNVPTIVSYGHTGWRMVNDDWFYFFNGGAISKNGLEEKFNVNLGATKLKDFQLPKPPIGDGLKDAIKASLEFLQLAPEKITYPIFAALYRVILGEISPLNYSIFLYGTTGQKKSELSALIQAHFGQEFHAKNLPGNWSSTTNALELLASIVKDAVCVVDDLAPQPSASETNVLLSKAERLLRAQGNQSGRGRLDSNIQQRAERYPRGLIISTGEDLPIGASLRSRMLILELSNGDVDVSKLTRLQEYARSGLFAQCMSAYVQWLAPQMSQLKSEIKNRHIELRNSMTVRGGHSRSPDMAASLTIGMEIFLEFCIASDGMLQGEVMEHLMKFQHALTETIEIQKIHQRSEDPVIRFLELLDSAISSGRAHIADSETNSAPRDPELWGWQLSSPAMEEDKTRHPLNQFIPKGDRVGWLPSTDELWLDSDAAYTVVQKMATDQKAAVTTSKQTLWKQLSEKNLLILPGGKDNVRKRASPQGNIHKWTSC